jgi:putative ABC transport system permease protein
LEKLFGLEMITIAGVLSSALLLVLAVLAAVGWRNNVLLKLGLRPILRRRTQSGLIILGLMLATLIITAAFVTGDTLSHTIRSLVIEELGPVDEIVQASGQASSAAGSTYFSFTRYEQLAGDLGEISLIDAFLPAIRESLPAVNLTRRQSVRTLQITGVRPEDADRALPLEELIDAQGNLLPLEAGEGRVLFLNKAAAEALQAEPGDTLKLYARSASRQYIVAGVAGSGRSPRAIIDLRQAQALFGERARINAILISNLGDAAHGARYSEQVTGELRGLLTDHTAARRLFGWLSADASAAQALRHAAVDYEGNTQADLVALAAGLDSGTLDENVESLLSDEGLAAEVQSILEGAEWRTEPMRRRIERGYEDLSAFVVDDVKRDGLDTAELAANAFTTIFVVTGLFGIASGLLLIFLIFVMLAAERKSEMGMTRAIGAQRGHLVQMFLYEGTAYDLAAAGVGVALGVLVGLIIALTLGRAFAASDLVIRPSVSLKGLVVSYCLGMLVTLVTVLFSANRVSRLNIVAAIRDLPEPPPPRRSLRDQLLSPLHTVLDGFRYLLHLRALRAVRTWIVGVPVSLLRLVWAGFRGGILTFLLGLVLIPAGMTGGSGAVFTLGVSLTLIGGGLVLRWILGLAFRRHGVLAERIAFTGMGLGLTLFWSLPSVAFERLGVHDLKTGPEMLFIAGFMMVIGAVMVVMYNTDLVLRLLLRLLGGSRRLAPVLRMAVAYPLANRFRTGLTLGMFGVVVFSVVFMATAFKANEAFFANTEAMTGGFELRAVTSAKNPIADLARSVSAKSELRTLGYAVVAAESTVPVELQQEAGRWDWYQVRGVDAAYLDYVEYDFAVKAQGYQSAAEIWQAVRDHPGYAVIDSYPVPSRQQTSIVIGGPEFKLSGVYLEDESMEPIRLRVREPGSEPFEVTVIGVVESSAAMNFGLITSQALLDRTLVDPPAPTRYYVHLEDGVDPGKAGSALESAFLEFGLESIDQIQEIKDAQTAQRAIEQLLLGFLTLGLIVGVAALGVISSRAVVERRQQIGVLRALGFQAQMVTWSFMAEASFVALLGISLGAALALIPAYQLISDAARDVPGLEFHVPWSSIALVVGMAYAMALLATYLPALQASRVAPAEALRYE